MRISGFATGMDIEQIVSDLMRAERIPVDKLMQTRQTVQWKMEGYREINRKLDAFRNSIFDGVIRQANMLAKKVTSTNESRISATSNSSAGNISLRISNVKSLAEAASYNSIESISSSDKKVSSASTLRSQADQFDQTINWNKGVVHSKNIQQSTNSNIVDLGKQNIIDENNAVVKVNGKVYQVTTEKENLTDDTVYLDAAAGTLEFNQTLKQGTSIHATFVTASETETFTVPEESDGRKIFQVSKGGLDLSAVKVTVGDDVYSQENGNIVTNRGDLGEGKIFVNLDTGQVEFYETQKDVSINVEYAQSYTTANISAKDENGKDVHNNFIFTANQSLNQVFSELNRSSVKVNGFYDEHTGKVNVTRTETGVFNEDGPEISFGGFFKDVLKLDETQTADSGARNAVFTLNGLETERRSNMFTVSGVTVTLKGLTDTDEVITLGSVTDTDKVFDTIKKFVDEYNELVDFVNGKLTEERYRDYKPLTNEQRESMSDRDIEIWEEKAKSGMLRNDYALRSPFDKMRLDVYSSVNSSLDTEFRHLSTIGITTSKDYLERGKLVINEDKLREAIEKDPEGVYQMFAADGNTYEEKGIGRRMRDTLDQAITSLAERAGGFRGKIANHQFTLGRELDSINNRITNFEYRLKQVEERYWRQFNAMESAVQRANQQGEMLFAQLFGGGQ